jgi:hypothetical protein
MLFTISRLLEPVLRREETKMGEREQAVREAAAGGDRRIAVVKTAFSFLGLEMHGLFEVFFSLAHYQCQRLNVIVDLNPHLFDINPTLGWREFEQEIIKLIGTRGFNFRLSNELKRRLEEILNYRRFEEFQLLIKEGTPDALELFLRDILIDLYGVGECRLIVETEFLEEADFADRAPDEQIVLVDEDGMADAPAGRTPETVVDGELVLAPVFGTAVAELAVGDLIFIRVHERVSARPLGLTPPRPPAQQAFVKSIIHDDLIGHTVFAEVRPGLLAKAIETENVRVRAVKQEQRRMFQGFFSWFIVLFLLLFGAVLFIFF